MKRWNTKGIALLVLGLITAPGFAGQFVVELTQPLQLSNDEPGITIDHSFAAGTDSYAVITSNNKQSLEEYLKANEITTEKISEVLFVNSPVLGGGAEAGEQPRDGHQVYIIERPIPGVGFFGLDKKTKISKGSNKAVSLLGEIIEWDRSYLTSEGTYCVYRADSPETLREHGALAGVPIGKITPVSHESY